MPRKWILYVRKWILYVRKWTLYAKEKGSIRQGNGLYMQGNGIYMPRKRNLYAKDIKKKMKICNQEMRESEMDEYD